MKRKYTVANVFEKNGELTVPKDCNDGWNAIVLEFVNKLQDIVDENQELSEIKITYIKEKWGALRINLIGYTDEIYKLVEDAEKRSCTVCEICGKKGTMREHKRWIKTLCRACYLDWIK